jgi:hypothetical protein
MIFACPAIKGVKRRRVIFVKTSPPWKLRAITNLVS